MIGADSPEKPNTAHTGTQQTHNTSKVYHQAGRPISAGGTLSTKLEAPDELTVAKLIPVVEIGCQTSS